jgi:hypothetical protein
MLVSLVWLNLLNSIFSLKILKIVCVCVCACVRACVCVCGGGGGGVGAFFLNFAYILGV